MTADNDFSDDQTCRDVQNTTVVGDQTPRVSRNVDSTPNGGAARLADPFLQLSADVLDDLESSRIANENRLRQLTRSEEDSDGEVRGLGLTIDDPDVQRVAIIVEELKDLEHKAELNLKRILRRHPLGPWVKETIGIGEKQGARLLAAIGDPYWNDLHDRPRTVSELWAYCGYRVILLPTTDHGKTGDQSFTVGGGGSTGGSDHTSTGDHCAYVGVAQRRVKGQRSNWSSTAKMRAFLIADSCIKQKHSPYRKVYDDGRAKYADALHQVECRRCGPAGKPALPGSPLSLGHQHGRALRLVTKEILKDLWREAREVHGVMDDAEEQVQ